MNAIPPLAQAAQAAPRTAAADPPQGQLLSSAQILSFQPGLYAVEIQVERAVVTAGGLQLPAARIDQLPSSAGRAIVAALSEGGWLSLADTTLFVRVVGEAADVLLTTYRIGGLPAPEVRIKAIRRVGAVEPESARPVPEPAPPVRWEALTLAVLAHVEKLGDITVGPGAWAGAPERDCAIEGFRLDPQHEFAGVALEYQAILGEQWQTPWFRSGEFCGSRGMSLALHGFRVRVAGESAGAFACRYWGAFGAGAEVGPVYGGEACGDGAAVLTGLRVEIVRREDVAAAAPPAAEARPGLLRGRRRR
jgi:hypothetical protein